MYKVSGNLFGPTQALGPKPPDALLNQIHTAGQNRIISILPIIIPAPLSYFFLQDLYILSPVII